MGFWTSQRVLVTGGCGFLGSYLVEELVAEGSDVVVVDNLETGRVRNLESVIDRIELRESDLTNLSACLDACRDIDIVMNLVGRTHGVAYSSQHQGEMLFHNATVQLNMLEAARQAQVSRFLCVSSSCVYPDDAEAPTPELSLMSGLPEGANEGYGWAKRIGELQAGYYQHEYGMNIAICRPFNPYGARYLWRGEENSHVIPSLVKKIMEGQNPLVVWGSGNQQRNFIHGRDAAHLMMLITENYATARPVNIGYEDAVSVADLVSLISRVSGRKPNIVFDTAKPEGKFVKSVDATLLREVSRNYTPRVSLEEGISEMLVWYSQTFGD